MRYVARLFQDGFSINPKRPRYGKGRRTLGHPLRDF